MRPRIATLSALQAIMANTKSAAKRARQTTKRAQQNKHVLSNLRGRLKRVRASIGSGKKEEAQTDFRSTISALDKAVKSGRIHRNSANRHKSILNRALAAKS